MSNTTQKKSRPVVVMNAVLAGAQVFVGGAAFTEVVPVKVAGLIILALAAITIGWSRYTEETVVPYEDVAAFVNKRGDEVAGPASPSSVAVGAPVVTVPAAEAQ